MKAVSGKKGAKKGAAATKGKKGKGGKKGTKADKGGKDKDSKKGKEENADKLTDFVITDGELTCQLIQNVFCVNHFLQFDNTCTFLLTYVIPLLPQPDIEL